MTIITLIQTITAVALIIVILLQNRGAGLGGVFGGGSGGSGTGPVFSTKRGVEKLLFRATIILTFIFIGLSLLNIAL